MIIKYTQKPFLEPGKSYGLLYLGLVLTQTQFVLNFPTLPLQGAPLTFLFIFILITLNFVYSTFQYAYKSNSRVAATLQTAQWLGLPLAALFLRFFMMTSDQTTIKIVCYLLFLLQSGLIIIKNLYFGTVGQDLGQISLISKMLRVARLILQITLPLLIQSHTTSGLIMAGCQAVSTVIVLFRFTFRKVLMEHCLLMLTLCGLVSGLDSVGAAVFSMSYFFIGEVFAIVLWMVPLNHISFLVQLKYLRSLAQKNELKGDEDILADFYFMRQCLFSSYRTMPLSPSTINQVATSAASQIRVSREGKVLEEMSNNKQNTEHYFEMLEGGLEGRIQFYAQFFNVAATRFKNSHNFECLQFLVDSALDFKGRYIQYALVLFYRYCEDNKSKSSPFELCRYDILYSKILRHYPQQVGDSEQIAFIAMFQNLKKLSTAIEKCFEAEVQFVENLLNDERRGDEFIEEKLLLRHKNKRKVRDSLEQCLTSKLYIYSSEVKFMLLLFAVSIEKRPEALKLKLKKLFFSSTARQLEGEIPLASVVLKGFTSGEVITSNQPFRKIIGQGNSSQTVPNIAELFPTVNQRHKHSELMADSYLSTEQKIPHESYECFLGTDCQLGGVRFRGLVSYNISTRIYYQFGEGFGYVCCLKATKREENILMLTRREADTLEKKGYEVITTSTFEKEQLGDKLEILRIEDGEIMTDSASESGSNRTSIQSAHQAKVLQNEDFLLDKITIIERKLNEEVSGSYFKRENWIEVVLILLLCLFLAVIFLSLRSSVRFLTNDETIQSVIVGQSGLSIRRVLMLKTILNFAHSTDMFPDDVCKNYAISSLTYYFESYLFFSLSTYFDKFTDLTYRRSSTFSQLSNAIFSSQKFFSSQDFPLSFQQYLHQFKADSYRWIFENKSKVLNLTYYETELPSMLLGDVSGNQSQLYDLVDVQIHAGLHAFAGLIRTLNIVIPLVVLVIVGTAITFRLKDTVPLFSYIRTVKTVKENILSSRLKELKYSIDQFNKFRSQGHSSLDIISDNSVRMQVGEKDVEVKTLKEFTNYDGHTKEYATEEQHSGSVEQEDSLLRNSERMNARKGSTSLLLGKLILYNKGYLLLMAILVFGCLFCSISLDNLFGKQMRVIEDFHQISQEFNLINKHYVHLLTYNWIKVVSLQHTINMTLPNLLYSKAIEDLENVKIIELIRKNYPEEYANSILYASICPYFQFPSYCQQYRNGVYRSGLSVMIPLTIKEFLEDDSMSDNYTYYLPKLCDRTNIISMGILLVTSKIPMQSFTLTNSKIDDLIPYYFISLICCGALMVVVTICCLCQSHFKVGKVREEVLSLDSVNNLYTMQQFKPYLNQIYYQ